MKMFSTFALSSILLFVAVLLLNETAEAGQWCAGCSAVWVETSGYCSSCLAKQSKFNSSIKANMKFSEFDLPEDGSAGHHPARGSRSRHLHKRYAMEGPQA